MERRLLAAVVIILLGVSLVGCAHNSHAEHHFGDDQPSEVIETHDDHSIPGHHHHDY